MLFRSSIVLALVVTLSLPASGISLFNLPDPALQQAAIFLRNKDYGSAHDLALKAPKSGIREFTLGMIAIRQEQWQDAISYLDYAADNFTILGDYAIYNEALALSRLSKHAEALTALRKMIRSYPESPLMRSALFLQGTELYDSGAFKEAYDVFTDFIDRYPAGADSLQASFKAALCREQTGNPAAAAAMLRTIPINYPASSLTPKATAELERLAKGGIKVEPLSAAEMLHQATILLDLGKHEQAVKTLDQALQNTTDADLSSRLLFKKGQALFKARHYNDAEQVFVVLSKSNLKKEETIVDVRFWLARTLARSGKDDEAFTAYLQLAETWPKAALADDALLEAAQIRKSQKKSEEALQLLQRSLFLYPESTQKKNVLWEIAWERYQAKDYKVAAEFFGKAAQYDGLRDKALYWQGKALSAAGNQEGASESFARLMAEFPLGYYALMHRKEAGIAFTDTIAPPKNLAEYLPVPPGLERIKALIALGLYEDASRELAGLKKPKLQQGIARLYLEMSNYNAALKLFKNEIPGKADKDAPIIWGINYPLAFSDHVARNAADNELPESLVYAIMRAESTYSPTALSPVGAVGLMQLMPATANAVAKGTVGKSSLTMPEYNIRYGSKHLKDLLAYHNGDLVKVIAAYNAGSGNVGKWEKRFGEMPRDQFIENIPFGETREYVKKVLAGMELYQRFYGLDQKPVEKTAEKPVEKTAANLPTGQ